MELGSWCKSLEDLIKGLSPNSRQAVPYMVDGLLEECRKAAAGEPDGNACVKIALAGTFSSGKSSFLNAVFDRDLTAVDIEQTTRCRTDFMYGPEFRITNVRTGKEISLEEYLKVSRIGHAKEDSHYLVLLPDPRLDGIVFMDTPGFDPPKDEKLDKEHQDAAISERAAEDSDIVFFLVEAKDGTIREDSLQYLRKLNARTAACDHPLRLIVILNKADLKMPSARQQILEDVKGICRKNRINVEHFILHTSRRPKKNPDFYLQCQSNIWNLVKTYQREKKIILDSRHGIWAQLSRQSLVDLRDILEKFSDSQEKRLDRKRRRIQQKSEEKTDEITEVVAERMKDLMLIFIRDNRWNYSSKRRIPNTGIFWNDWKAFITDNGDKVIPSGDTRTEFQQKIQAVLENYSIPSPQAYAKRLLEDVDNLILSVFLEVDDTQHYKRCGKSSVCDYESDADKLSKEWQEEFYDVLESQATGYFGERTKNALSSLLTMDDASEKQAVENDRKILWKINSLLYSDFPALNEKSAYQHPILDSGVREQRVYVALLQTAAQCLDESARQRILDEIKQLNKVGNLGFSDESLESFDRNAANRILSEPTDLVDDDKSRLVMWVLEDAGFASINPALGKKVLSVIGKIPLFSEVDTESMQGIFTFGACAAAAKDEADLAEKAKFCENYPPAWAHLMINRGFDAATYRMFESAAMVFSWEELAYMFRTHDFTKGRNGILLLEKCMFGSFNRNAADFLIEHGCNVHAVSRSSDEERDDDDDEEEGNVLQHCSPFLSEEALTYLLDHGVRLTKDVLDDFFMYDESELIAIATKRDPDGIPAESVFNGLIMSLETLKAYGENGGNLDIYSEENECSLVDFFVRNDLNDLVEYMRAHGISPSEDARSFSQIIDELR